MGKKIPSYSLCQVLGKERCADEVFVARLQELPHLVTTWTEPHRHDFYQIVLFTQGSGTHTIDFQQYHIQPHHIYYSAPGQIHSWQFGPDTDGFILQFNDSFFASMCQNPYYIREFPLFAAISTDPVNTLDLSCCSEVAQTFSQLLTEYRRPEAFQNDLLRGLLMVILVKLSRALPMQRQEGVSKHSLAQLREFETLIEQHFREKRLPKAYAEMMFITPNHLNTLVSSLVGRSAGELIRQRVLVEAKRMLVNSDLMISQIADALHFEDNAYFTRFFKKYTGQTPEGFRASFDQLQNLGTKGKA